MLAWRRLLGETLIEWHGETEIHPPTGLRRDPRDPFLRVELDSDEFADNLRDERPRLLRPDAIVEVDDPGGGTPLTYLIEFDRTRRVDKSYDKFRRYDCLLNWWWRYTDLGGLDDAPFVVFICQDRDRALLFLNAADRELTGNVSRPWSQDDDYVGRRRVAFCLEQSVYEGSPDIWLLPEHNPREWEESGERRPIRSWLPGVRADGGEAADAASAA